ncbi:hypothetical protein CBR_g55628 [Chara braunii]|uniref:Integrase catalytic domain-containing protein n=1 Tax=Chara braunii TaxID=69332 RepID=A0A388MD38_CHABU|nr:hypothetical protein CBR_g55628 [Chara braunii]|eukprot:GBG92477.1 hypothetical protein CBR_g55628 [Chara braunii]
MTGYYRTFVKNYSIVVAPLTDLTRLDTPWEWTDECEAAFRHLKHALTHYEVLKLPNPDKPFIVTTDASQYGIGVVLVQQEGPKLRPVEYMSKKMSSQKLAMSTYDKELYAVFKALTHWRHYLLGRFFILRTDHQTLRWKRTQPVLSDTLKRWIEVIEQYDFDPQYIKGEYNKAVDALSRRPDFSGAPITEYDLTDDVTRSLVEAYREDQFMSEIIRRLEAKDKQTSAEFELVNGLLFLEKEGNKHLCVPDKESLRSLFLGECHDATGYFGYKKTATNLLQRFWWPTMLKDAKLYVETCQVCQRDKPRTQDPLGLLKPLPIPESPGESLSMDFMDTLVTNKSGMRQFFVIVDRFSKYARLIAMPETAKTEYVIRLFKENWVRDFGLPKSIVSDRDARFTSELWKAAAVEQGTQLQMTSGNHPEANGQAEQMNHVVQHLLRHYIKPNQVDWDEKLALVASLYNNVVHSATGTMDSALAFLPDVSLSISPTLAVVAPPEPARRDDTRRDRGFDEFGGDTILHPPEFGTPAIFYVGAPWAAEQGLAEEVARNRRGRPTVTAQRSLGGSLEAAAADFVAHGGHGSQQLSDGVSSVHPPDEGPQREPYRGPTKTLEARPPGVIRSDGGEGVGQDTVQPGSDDVGRSFGGGIERRGSSTTHPSIVRPSAHDVGDEPRSHLMGMRDITPYEEQHGRPIRAKTTDVHDTRTATVRLSRAKKKGTSASISYHQRHPQLFFRNRDETRQMPAAADGQGGVDGGDRVDESGRGEKRRGGTIIIHDDSSTTAEGGETTGVDDPDDSDYVPRFQTADEDDGGGRRVRMRTGPGPQGHCTPSAHLPPIDQQAQARSLLRRLGEQRLARGTSLPHQHPGENPGDM